MTGDSKEVFNKIFKKFTSIEELNDHYFGVGEWNKEYPFSEGEGAICDFCREHNPLLGHDLFWIEEPDCDEEERTITLWCIYYINALRKEQIRQSMKTLEEAVKKLTNFEMEWEFDKDGETYVYITFKFRN